MRDKDRIAKILHLIYRIWTKYPDLRLLQLLLNSLKEEEKDFSYLYNMEEEVLFVKLKETYSNVK